MIFLQVRRRTQIPRGPENSSDDGMTTIIRTQHRLFDDTASPSTIIHHRPTGGADEDFVNNTKSLKGGEFVKPIVRDVKSREDHFETFGLNTLPFSSGNNRDAEAHAMCPS